MVVTGLTDSAYSLTPTYVGGVSGTPFQISVGSDPLSFLSVAPPAVGGVRIALADRICGEAHNLIVWEQGGDATPLARFRRVVSPLEGQCAIELQGLNSGAHDIEATSNDGALIATKSFEVVRERIAVVELDAPVVRVFGTLTINGKPPGGTVHIRFHRNESHTFSMVTVAADGTFTTRLPEIGEYTLEASTDVLAVGGQQRLLKAVEGYNRVDWEISGTTLSVAIANWDRAFPVDLHLATVRPGRPGQWVISERRLALNTELPSKVTGLAAGHYVVEAREDRSGAPRVARQLFEITESQLAKEVTLDLQTYSSIISLRSISGGPISGANVTTVHGTAVESASEPGQYRLSAEIASDGAPVEIGAGGFVPTCATAPASSVVSLVTMQPGAITRIRYEGTPTMGVPEGLISWPGSTCWVAMRRFDSVKTSEPSTFVVSNSLRRNHILFCSAIGRFRSKPQLME
jgi:hypothetical protein